MALNATQLAAAQAAKAKAAADRTARDKYLINLARYNKTPGFKATLLPKGWTPANPVLKDGTVQAKWGNTALGVGVQAAAKGNAGGSATAPGGEGGEAADYISEAGATPAWLLSNPNVADVLKDPAKLSELMSLYGISGADLNAQLAQAIPAYAFAGLEQWNNNLQGNRSLVEDNPWLQNVDPYVSKQQLQKMVGEMMAGLQEGDKAFNTVKSSWSSRLTNPNLPEWAGRVYEEQLSRKGGGDAYSYLMGNEGSVFSLELLMSPDINYLDPNAPLFGKDAHPTSLSQLTGFQTGEETLLRGMSAEELMMQVYPMYDAYYNRGAGNPVPEQFASTGGPMLGNEGGGFLRQTDAYKQAGAYGMLDPNNMGWINDTFGGQGSTYSPLLNTGSPGAPYLGGFGLAGDILSGEVQPNYFGGGAATSWAALNANPAWSSFLPNNFGLTGTAAFLQDPSIWFQGEREPYGNIDEATRNRYSTLMGYY